MSGHIELWSMLSFLLVFLGTGAIGSFFFLRAYGDERRVRDRIRALAQQEDGEGAGAGLADLARTAFPRLGALLLPSKEDSLSRMKARLLQGGLYQPNALKVFYGIKLALLLVLPLLMAAIPFAVGAVNLRWAVYMSTGASALAIVLPNLWLMERIGNRHRELRRGLPDALDMLVLCVEGGLSLTAAMQRITSELQEVHPTLAEELDIVQQTGRLGLSIGDGFKQFGERTDVAEIRDLASVLQQSERYGAGIVKALRGYADHFREQRQQEAEEKAQVAAVKILFPMLLFIFPSVFIVLLGPAIFYLTSMFNR